jgi:hypothetical protein
MLVFSLSASPVSLALAWLPTPLDADVRLEVEARRVCDTGGVPTFPSWFSQGTAVAAGSPLDLFPRWCVHHSPPWSGQPFLVRVVVVTAGVPGAPVDVSCVAA